MDWPEGLSENAKKAITEAGIESLDDLLAFSLDELRSPTGFNCTLKDITILRKNKRPREELGDTKNEEDLLLTFAGDPLSVQSFLPTKIPAHDLTSLRSAVFGAAKADASPHLKQELDFLCSLLLQVREKELSLRTSIWARTIQVILKSIYPTHSLRIAELWAASWSKIPDLSDLALTRHVQRVRSEVEKLKPPQFNQHSGYSTSTGYNNNNNKKYTFRRV